MMESNYRNSAKFEALEVKVRAEMDGVPAVAAAADAIYQALVVDDCRAALAAMTRLRAAVARASPTSLELTTKTDKLGLDLGAGCPAPEAGAPDAVAADARARDARAPDARASDARARPTLATGGRLDAGDDPCGGAQ
jgi:hypothetical protein